MVIVIALVPDNLLEHGPELWLNIIVNWQFSSIDNTHVHTILNCMVKEDRVEGLTEVDKPTERERKVGESTTDVHVGAGLLDCFTSLDVVLCVVVVLIHTSGDRQNIQVKDDVLREEIDRLQEVVCSHTDINFIL